VNAGPPPVGSDEDLLRATGRGDEAAFLQVYRRYQEKVYRYAARMTGSADAAQDVTHDCFASLLEAPSRYDARRAGLGTYLCTAARNLSLRHASRCWRERASGRSADLTPSRMPTPLQQLLQDERARIVRDAVLSLAPLHREVLVLAEYEELDMASIARIVGAEVGTVKVRLHRARQKLRRVLQAQAVTGALAE
jgi:RNA polymerase sigma-70 factor (ECF subfamily)